MLMMIMMVRIPRILVVPIAMLCFSACNLRSTGSTVAGGVAPVNVDDGELAMEGIDAVSYFAEGGPIEGSQEFQSRWNGANWRFANAANRDVFAASPERYAPQYGGYCAYAVSRGYTANGDPRVWKLVDGKLYLNYSERAKRLWEENIPQNVKQADHNWPRFLEQKPEHKG